MNSYSLDHAVRDGVARAAGVVALAGVALIHVLDAPNTFPAVPYIGVLYVALIAGCTLTAGALIRGSATRAWLAAALLPLGAIVGFTLTRTVGLPGDTGDIGNWSEPLGMASLFVEGSLVAIAAMVLRERVDTVTRRVARRASWQTVEA
jgi:hypothetical protein